MINELTFTPVMMAVPLEVHDAIQAVLAHVSETPFTEGRWPYTYGYDFLRCYPDMFDKENPCVYGWGTSDSCSMAPARADAAKYLRVMFGQDGDELRDRVVEALAYAYCLEYRIAIPEHVKNDPTWRPKE